METDVGHPTDLIAPDDSLYSWVDAGLDDDHDVDLTGATVTAVLVAHNAAPWLAATLTALQGSEHRPDRLVAISTGSADNTVALLQQAADAGVVDAVYHSTSASGFGEAVAQALRLDADVRPTPAGDWLWLLHDDGIVARDCLTRLLRHVVSEARVDITGPKLLSPKLRGRPQQISEVGVSISGTARRELYLDRNEINQGQRDSVAERLGVSTCGMLVRHDVWERLGGLDPALPVFRDGVDFGWRAHRAGYRVVTTPRAEIVHRQVGRAGLRRASVASRHPAELDRILGLRVVAAHASTVRLPLVWLRLVLNCLVHVVAYLLGKVPQRAWEETLALVAFVAHPGTIAGMRRRLRAAPIADRADDTVLRLRPAWWSELRSGVEIVSAAVADRYRAVAGDLEASSLDELTGDDFAAVAETRPRSPWLSPIVIATVLSAVASVLAARNLIGRGSLVAPALLPAPDLGGLWHRFLDPVAGAPSTTAPPWLGVAAIGSTVFAGRPEWFISVLLLAVVPLALVSVYPLVRRTVEDRRIRLWVAVSYSLLPVLLGGTAQGRLEMAVYALALPLLGIAGRALVLRRPTGPESWRGGWGSGLVLVALAAFEPSILLLALAVGVVGALTVARTGRKVARIALALGVPLLVLAPWWPTLLAHPGRFFAGPDAAAQPAVGAPSSGWTLLLGRGLGDGLPPLWLALPVFGAVWLGAFAALVLRPRSRAVLTGWTVAVVAFAAAVLVSRLVVAVPPAGIEVRPWVGVYVLIGFAALVLAAGAGVDGVTARIGSRSFSLVQPGTVLAAVLAVVITLTAVGWWVWAGLDGPLHRARLTAIPPYVQNAQQGPERVRTLAIDLSGSRAGYAVLADDGIRLGDAERGFAFGGSAEARSAVTDLTRRLLAGTADDDIVPGLARLGIGYVWLRGASDAEQARIDNTPGLGTASGSAGAVIWDVEPATSRATVDGGGAASPTSRGAVVPAGAADRVLRIGEPADPRWRATIDGRPLTPSGGGWDAAFVLPAEGGRISYRLPGHSGWEGLLQGVLLLVVAVLAAPAIRRPEVRDPVRTARRVAVAPVVPAPSRLPRPPLRPRGRR